MSFSFHSAGLLFISAKHAAKRAFEMEGRIGQQSEAMTAVVLSVIVLETGINEIAEWVDHSHEWAFKVPHGTPHGFEAMELRTKWSVLPMVIRQKSFDRAAEPWQSFEALVSLRNAIVHAKPGQSLTKHSKGLLRAKGVLEDREDTFLTFGVAEWACDTVARMFDRLTELLNVPEKTIRVSWTWTPKHSFPYGLSTPGDPFPRPAPTPPKEPRK